MVAIEIAAAITGQSTPCCVGEWNAEEQRYERWAVGIDYGWIMWVCGGARLIDGTHKLGPREFGHP